MMQATPQTAYKALRNPAPIAARTHLSTEEAAARLGIKAQTLRAALCRNGEYYGIRPFKSKNRFLRWPAAAVEAIAAGEVSA